ncbi:hypothetical protein ACVI1J_004207 [Bradyrhizobium diazoefficiens]
MIGAGHRDLAVLQRLAQRIQHARIELRQLVEEQHALMRERDLAGLGVHAAAGERGHAGGMMRRAERAPRSQRTAFDLAGDGGDHRSPGDSGGRIEGRRAASIDLPAPGAPIISR